MNLTQLSRDRVTLSASSWSVPSEYLDPLYNYLVLGYEPGSFWSAVLANDFMAAIQSSHPSNDIYRLKNAVGWIQDTWPTPSHGTVEVVRHWLALSAAQRRTHLEQCSLIYTEQQEIMLGLKGDSSLEPQLS